MKSLETEFSKKARKANKIDRQGMTPIMHKAAKGKNEDIIELLENGADINFTKLPADKFCSCKYRNGTTALHVAIEKGQLNTVKLLLDYNANTELTDSEGYTPLDLAVENLNQNVEALNLKERLYVPMPMVLGSDKNLKAENYKYNMIVKLLVDKDAPKNLFQTHEDAEHHLKENRTMGKKIVSFLGKN